MKGHLRVKDGFVEWWVEEYGRYVMVCYYTIECMTYELDYMLKYGKDYYTDGLMEAFKDSYGLLIKRLITAR